MKYCSVISFLFILFFTISCTPYNSDNVNKQMIQGTWKLIDVEHSVYDSVYVNYAKEQTYLMYRY